MTKLIQHVFENSEAFAAAHSFHSEHGEEGGPCVKIEAPSAHVFWQSPGDFCRRVRRGMYRDFRARTRRKVV